ncbi:hypothetical protein C9374_009798 [Naegleria lovaniensis]|uniref:Uncharacterized protein n=1 Tax=Naegleria lovaniensis TaxID=51637 RepID=A0AA88H5M2_NAELO|nr:uncharacterized protein C9374_009798 [Naegleria lovaniensis]KAG2393221.1 hypothetical protein C9374_009798 [Naegleria lovaniensis]
MCENATTFPAHISLIDFQLPSFNRDSADCLIQQLTTQLTSPKLQQTLGTWGVASSAPNFFSNPSAIQISHNHQVILVCESSKSSQEPYNDRIQVFDLITKQFKCFLPFPDQLIRSLVVEENYKLKQDAIIFDTYLMDNSPLYDYYSKLCVLKYDLKHLLSQGVAKTEPMTSHGYYLQTSYVWKSDQFESPQGMAIQYSSSESRLFKKGNDQVITSSNRLYVCEANFLGPSIKIVNCSNGTLLERLEVPFIPQAVAIHNDYDDGELALALLSSTSAKVYVIVRQKNEENSSSPKPVKLDSIENDDEVEESFYESDEEFSFNGGEWKCVLQFGNLQKDKQRRLNVHSILYDRLAQCYLVGSKEGVTYFNKEGREVKKLNIGCSVGNSSLSGICLNERRDPCYELYVCDSYHRVVQVFK